MNELTPYYTPVDNEILGLLDHFVSLVNEFERRGGNDPEAGLKLAELGKLRDLVHRAATIRRKRAEERADIAVQEMESRTRMLCPECKEERKVKIIGQQRVQPPGVTYDKVECTTCGKAFMADLPITTKDKIRIADHLVEKLTTIGSDGKTTTERQKKEESVMLMMKNLRTLRNAHQEEKAQEDHYKQSHENAERQLVATRDMLVLWKLQAANPGGGGMA